MLDVRSSRWPAVPILCTLTSILLSWPGMAQSSGYSALERSETALSLHAEATPRRFIAAHGRAGMVVGYAAESLEGWVYPFRIFHDYRVSFRSEGGSDAVPGSALVRDITVNPESVTRVYSGQGFTATETIFVPLDEAGLLILYRVRSAAPLHLIVSFQPDLDLMWPGGIGGQSCDWDANRRAFLLQESSEKYSALLGSPVAGNHTAPGDYSRPWIANRTLSLELDIPAAHEAPRYYPLVVSCGIPGHYDAGKNYDRLLEEAPKLYAEAVEHYRKLVESHVQVETPDRDVNLAYSWARIALDQAYVCSPFLGCGLVAGYGPSRDTRRPQYAWFFGGDAMTNTFALEAAGDFDLARDALRFIQKYQKRDSGEIFHELSQSAGIIDWFKDYPYAYRHTDVSALYLVAVRNYYRSTGDLDLLRSSWDSLRGAYNYLVSRIDPQDGLVRVPPGGWGGDETISEQVVKDIYLESVWVAGAESFAGLATLVGDSQAASDARGRAEKARASISAKLWNPTRGFFFFGFNGRGNLLTQELGQPNWGIWLGAFADDQAARALDYMAHASWETDWGMRSIPAGDPLYIGDSYGHGSVWPMGTGVQALAFYRYHRPLQGFPLWRALVEESFLNSLGHVSEVLSGDFYRELDVSVPEQMWSSGMVITPFLRGLLGLQLYAPMGKLFFAPHLPPNWPGVKIRSLKIGRSTLNLEMEQSASQVTLRVENDGPPIEIEFTPEIPLGSAGTHGEGLQATLGRQSLPVKLESHAQDVHATVKFSADQKSELKIAFKPGVRPWAPFERLQVGDTNHGLRILSSSLQGRTYRAELEGQPSACSAFALSTPWQVREVKGGKLRAHQGNDWWFIASPVPDSCESSAQDAYQTWTLQVELAP
jgi:glycogen debranching enzyme